MPKMINVLPHRNITEIKNFTMKKYNFALYIGKWIRKQCANFSSPNYSYIWPITSLKIRFFLIFFGFCLKNLTVGIRKARRRRQWERIVNSKKNDKDEKMLFSLLNVSYTSKKRVSPSSHLTCLFINLFSSHLSLSLAYFSDRYWSRDIMGQYILRV